ncbi:MAG: hypothetical protein L6R41_001518 [Letrouitia leprolyta]|nr:MAG: hypothetical protein L6R41_001518 [Letrouitia leprolyta]
MFIFALLSFVFISNLVSAIVQSPVKGPLKGFNYNPDDDAATLFPLVKNELPNIGAPGFTSARLYTALDQDSKEPKPHPAFKAAADTKTAVLIGLAVSLGDEAFEEELKALEAVLSDKDGTYGNLVSKNLIVGISVGNEDFYRQSIQGTPMAKTQGDGSQPDVIMKQINQVRDLLKEQTPSLISKIPVGHADTWRMWTLEEYGKQLLIANSTMDFKPIDFIGMQEFIYWEGYDVHNWTSYRTEALAAVKAAAGNIPIWATETGWPVSGPKCCDEDTNAAAKQGLLAWPGKEEAQIIWNGVGCQTLFAGSGSDARNTWWYRVFASPGKSATADGELDWRVLANVTGSTGATAAFPLDCKAAVPSVAIPTASATAESPGAVTSVPVRGFVSLILLFVGLGFT